VVEFFIQKEAIGDPESMRIVYHAMKIPTMTQWGVMALILLFGCGSLFVLRRRKRLSRLLIVLISLLTIAGL
jgi:hypothetical protein